MSFSSGGSSGSLSGDSDVAFNNPADQQSLIYSASLSKWQNQLATTQIAIQNQGTTLTSQPTTINFTGSGVQATNSSGVVSVAVNSTSGGSSVVGGRPIYDAVTDGSVLNDGSGNQVSALNSAKSAALSAGLPLYLPAGTYRITSALSWYDDNLTVIGDGPERTTILQATNNVACMNVGGKNQYWEGLEFAHATLGSSTYSGGHDLGLHEIYFSTFRNIRTYNGSRGIHGLAPPDQGDSSIYFSIFSCTFTDIWMSLHCSSFVYIGSYGQTGSIWTNVYMINTDGNGNTYGCQDSAIVMDYCDEGEFNQVNIEDVDMTQTGNDSVVSLFYTRAFSLRNIHFERVKLRGTSSACLIKTDGDNSTRVHGGSWVFSDVPAGANGASLFYAAGGARLHIDGFDMHDPWVEQGANLSFVKVEGGAEVYIDATRTTTTPQTSSPSNMGTTASWQSGNQPANLVVGENSFPGVPMLKRCNEQLFTYTNAAGQRTINGTTVPTSGSWQKGDRCINTQPNAGAVVEWVCTTAGSPGTWTSLTLN